jgi:lipopolysaccharide biosynthesis regulator YciM
MLRLPAVERAGPIAALLAAVVALVLAGSAACQDADPGKRHPPTSTSAGRAAVDTTLVAFLSKARAANHAADLAIAKGDRRAAIAHLQRVTQSPRPPLSPEVVEVLADAHARLAELWSEEGEFGAANEEVDDGLELAREVTLFRANLFMARGIAEERRMKSLEARGDEKGAAAARDAALQAFDTSMTLQERVIDQALAPDPEQQD